MTYFLEMIKWQPVAAEIEDEIFKNSSILVLIGNRLPQHSAISRVGA